MNGQTGAELWHVNGSLAGDNAGWAVAGIGDLNNDGKADFAIGAPRFSLLHTDAGRVTIFSGSTHLKLQTLDGDAADDRFGSAIAGKRFTASGIIFDMVAIGAPNNDAGASNAGRVKVYLRNITAPSCTKPLCLLYTINGGNAGDKFGSAVALGNLVGTSVVDILVGAPYTDFAGTDSGVVYIFDGSNGTQAARIMGEAAGDHYGTSLDNAGDADGDGFNDLLVGAPFSDVGGTSAGRAYLVYAAGPTVDAPGAGPTFPNTAADSTPALRAPGRAGTPDSESRDTFRDPQVIIGAALAADINADGAVDGTDLTLLLDDWGPCAQPMGCAADLNRDGTVNIDDMMMLLAAWHTP